MVSALQQLLLLISLSTSRCLGAKADTHAAAGYDHELNFMVVATSTLKLIAQDAVCSVHKVMPSTGNRTTWVPMNRPYGPCSSSSSSRAVVVDVDDMLLWDQLRSSYIRTQLSNVGGASEGVPIIARTTIVYNRDYMPELTASVGGNSTTSKSIQKSDQTVTDEHHITASQTVVVDTSSDIPWVQCLPCPIPQCHPQKDPFYDPTKSSTYAPIPCDSPACKELGSSCGNGCSAHTDECKYIVNYGDGRATTGTYVTDTLTMSPTIMVKDFRFGCSHAVRGFFSDQTAGVLALGGGGGSLLAQTAEAYGNAFSYCIPQSSSSGFLSLGGPAEASSKFARTPLIKNKHAPTFYIVCLEAITVAGKQLGVPPAAFAAGTVMDSGAVITQLPPAAYAELRAAFRSAMASYGPLAAPVRNLDTCYDFTRFPEVKVPKVSLVFAGGATLELDAASVMLDSCLAFAAIPDEESVGFIGNVQQQTYEVLYDVGGGCVGFRRGAC